MMGTSLGHQLVQSLGVKPRPSGTRWYRSWRVGACQSMKNWSKGMFKDVGHYLGWLVQVKMMPRRIDDPMARFKGFVIFHDHSAILES
ncbi:hypothetical protein LINPERPRIM_LOCUS30357, partial [Linum perenne]